MLLFFEVLCAYFAAVGVFFLAREAYYCISRDKDSSYVCIYIARDDENEEDARKVLESEDLSGKVVVIYGEDRDIEKKITDLCIKNGKLYIKK